MENTKESVEVVNLDGRFSTTRRVVKSSAPAFKGCAACREGGIRTRGYFKCGETNKPLVSVVTVVKNGRQVLEHAILSVIRQSYDNVEYIVVDGGSADGTVELIEGYDDVIDYWVSEPDEGVYDAMNKGVRLSKGDYVLFLGSDDNLFDALEEVVNYMDDEAISYYGNVVLSKNNSLYGGRFYPLKLFVKNIPHQAIFYSKFVFQQYRYSGRYKAVADYELNLKIFADDALGLKYIPVTIAEYNNEDGISSNYIDHVFSAEKSDLICEYYSVLHCLIYKCLRYLRSISKIKTG